MSDRVVRRRARTRERIFTEAMRLFAERGFDRVTVADITEAADIGKGTFFTHFPSKRDVFRYLGEQVTEVMEAAAQESGTAQERLARLLGAATAWLEDHPEPARQMVGSRSFSASLDLASPSQQRFHQVLARILADGVAAGQLRADLPVDDAAQLVQTGYYMSVLTWAASLEPQQEHRAADQEHRAADQEHRAADQEHRAADQEHRAADRDAQETRRGPAARAVRDAEDDRSTLRAAPDERPLGERVQTMLDLVLRGMK
ncbi:TetR/AcrR family transcriptional regulator [Actinomyces wuliandei]|uniref:TetR/AcrR family transcriptional regulator n=1 Tax=Actinomyces wuliandei TaxID=2057743 RepID=UPI0019D424E0|nr:TetR/AcrR family transcriptional regulator [Actinomyces wuliandei]